MAGPTVIRSEAFVNAEGVNTHVNYNDGAYANVTNVINDLAYLEITHVRDGMNSLWQFGSYESVAAAGIKFTLVVGGGSFSATSGTPGDPSLNQRIGYINSLEQATPGSIFAIEGTNEINNFPIVFNGLGKSGVGTDELNAALALQRALYAVVHSDPALHGVPVDYFTGYGAGSIPLGPDPASVPGLADFDTQHPYPNGGQPPSFWVSRAQALGNETAANAATMTPAVYTETGYSSNGGTKGGVNEDVQAKYILDLLLDDAKNGIAATDLYELLDAYAPGSRQGDAGFGLFDDTGAAKPVAFALHNMNALLTDTAAEATSFAARPLSCTISGQSSTGDHLVLEKSNGSYIVAFWDEQPIWNEKLGHETAAIPHTVTLSLSFLANTVITEFDPMQGTVPVASFRGTKASVVVTDHPVFLQVTSGTTKGNGASNPNLVSPNLELSRGKPYATC